jgi:hexokinase
MKFNKHNCDAFAKAYGFHYDLINDEQLIRDIRTDMDRGLRGEDSSLAMIPAYINSGAPLERGKKVLALDAGGTNLRAALVSFNEKGEPITEGLSKSPMPGTKPDEHGQRHPIGAEAFFDQMAAQAGPLLEGAAERGEKVEGVGFCFSYPMTITSDADGILLMLSKEIEAPELIGKAIGAGLREALEKRGTKAPERIVLLNDTTAALLSGKAEIPADGGWNRGADKYGVPQGPVVGLILGTGFNVAYPAASIPKINFHNPENPQIIVCESGNIDPYCLGRLDHSFDQSTKTPNLYHLEKATSGAYIGGLVLHIWKQAIRDGLLDFRKKEELLALESIETRYVNEWMWSPLCGEGPVAAYFGKDELDALKTAAYLCTIVTERGGVIAASAVAGAAHQMEAESGDCLSNPFKPLRIAVEGTTYMVYKYMRRAFESALHKMLAGRKPAYYTVAPVDQASLFGAAVAALSK